MARGNTDNSDPKIILQNMTRGRTTRTELMDLTVPVAQTPTREQYPAIRASLAEIESVRPRRDQIAMISLVGSHGYGLAHEKSDLDFRGFFVAPSREFWGLRPPSEQLECKEPDFCAYEIGKFTRLALAANPNVLEILWADAVWLTKDGEDLRSIRQQFLSQRVRKTYMGYAAGQVKSVLKGQRDALYVKRRPKAIRHLFRLYEQGMEILTTGDLTYRLRDPERIKAMSTIDDATLEREFAILDKKFQEAKTDLPLLPNEEAVNQVLMRIRERNYRK